MELEFVGGSHDGGTLEVADENLAAFTLPLYLDPLKPLFTIKDDTGKPQPPPPAEVYQMEEPGKLLFQGWVE